MIYWQLLLVYLKVGLFGFGGGYAMLSLIQDEIVTKHAWLTEQQFTDIIAVSQVTPGPIGINSATYVGYSVTGSVWGSILATVAVCIPSFIMVIAIALAFAKVRHNRWVDAAFTGIRPASVGLIAAAALMLSLRAGFIGNWIAAEPGTFSIDQVVVTDNFPDYKSLLIFAFTFLAMIKKWIHPILLIGVTGVLGFILFYVL